MHTARMDSERIPHTASPAILHALSQIGRTEDVKLSPQNDFLAIADASNDQIVLVYFAVQTNPEASIHISRTLTLKSAHLKYPHGISFLDSKTMVVANRLGDVSAFRVPAGTEHTEVFVEPLFLLSESKQTKIQNPGSVEVYKLSDDTYRMLICNNHLHTVTSHKLKVAEGIAISGHRVVVRRKLIIPDGLAVSPDKRWMAVSNHVTGELMVYRNHFLLNRFTAPAAVMGGMVCPHGVRFSSDGKSLIVADAASAYLHLFEREGEDWQNLSAPTKSVRFLNENQFAEGRTNPEEGGVKGLDMSHDGSLLVTTCEVDTLAFYAMSVFGVAKKLDIADEIGQLCRERDEVLTANIYATADTYFWE